MSSSPSQRAIQLSRATQSHLHTLLLRHQITEKKGVLISISSVEYSADLSVARIYLSVYPEGEKHLVWERIQERAPLLQKQLHQALRHQIRKMPQFLFLQDNTMERAGHILHLINNLQHTEHTQ